MPPPRRRRPSLSIGLKPLLELSEQLDRWAAHPRGANPFDTTPEQNLRYILSQYPDLTVDEARQVMWRRLMTFEGLRRVG